MTISCKAKGNTMKIEYTKVGDYYLPNLYYPEETRPIGFWGMLRKEYLKEHKPGTYTYLLLTASSLFFLYCNTWPVTNILVGTR